MSYHLAMFDGHWSNASGDIKYLICNFINTSNFISQSLFMLLHHLAKLGGYRYCSSRDVFSLSRNQARSRHLSGQRDRYYNDRSLSS